MVYNLILINTKTNSCLYNHNYAGKALEPELVTSMYSSLTAFTKSLFDQDLVSIDMEKSRLVFRATKGPFIIVVHMPSDTSSSWASAFLEDVEAMLTMLFGPVSKWGEPGIFCIDGLEDFVEELVKRPLMARIGGLLQVALPSSSVEVVDKALLELERHPNVISSAMLLESFIVHSRLPVLASRMILHYLSVRPLGTQHQRVSPIYINGQWHSLVVRKVRQFVVVILMDLSASALTLQDKVAKFTDLLFDNSIDMLTRLPQVLIRHFAGQDVVMLLYRNQRTGQAIMPEFRLGSKTEVTVARRVYWWFYSRLRLVREGYQFQAVRDGVEELMVLSVADVEAGTPILDILERVRQRIA